MHYRRGGQTGADRPEARPNQGEARLLGPGLCCRERPSRKRTRKLWARIGHGIGVINFSGARFPCPKIPSDKALRCIRRDDHEIRMTSLVILVIWMFE